MKSFLLAIVFGGFLLHAQNDQLEGLWQGYDGEWGHCSRQLVSLAQAIPGEKFNWRPAPGVRSTGEVFLHLAAANFMLLHAAGVAIPADVDPQKLEKGNTSKEAVVDLLKRSLDAVKVAHAGVTPANLQKKVNIFGRNANVDGIYLRMLVHANEHMGQLIAYARVNGVTPPWSISVSKSR